MRFVRGHEAKSPEELTATYAPLIDELSVGNTVISNDTCQDVANACIFSPCVTCPKGSYRRFSNVVIRVPVGARAADQKEIVLFNGKNFSGWTFYLEEKDYNANGKGRIADFASVQPGGIIEMHPKLHGALMAFGLVPLTYPMVASAPKSDELPDVASGSRT